MQLNTLGVVHDFLKHSVKPGGLCIDATMGRGRDTALLCRLTGAQGRVLSFDIQPEALTKTKALLAQEGLTNAELILDSHANMASYAPAESVDAVVFNFGRLPGGDPRIMTGRESSLAALEAALTLLKPGGVMALAIYYGGENGYGERDAILRWLTGVDAKRFSVLRCDWCNRSGDPPIPVLLWKER